MISITFQLLKKHYTSLIEFYSLVLNWNRRQISVKNEEKRLKEEEKAREEEEKQRKAALVKNKFAQFFTKVDVPKSETDVSIWRKQSIILNVMYQAKRCPNWISYLKENQKMYRFMSFQVKANMSQAPINRRPDINDFEEFKQKMDEALRKCRSVIPRLTLLTYFHKILK